MGGPGCQSSWAPFYLKLQFSVLFCPILASVSFRGLPLPKIFPNSDKHGAFRDSIGAAVRFFPTRRVARGSETTREFQKRIHGKYEGVKFQINGKLPGREINLNEPTRNAALNKLGEGETWEIPERPISTDAEIANKIETDLWGAVTGSFCK